MRRKRIEVKIQEHVITSECTSFTIEKIDAEDAYNGKESYRLIEWQMYKDGQLCIENIIQASERFILNYVDRYLNKFIKIVE